MQVPTVELEITDATQTATAWRDNRPVATLVRRRAGEPKTAPVWTAYDVNGGKLFATHLASPATLLARRVGLALDAKAARAAA